MLSNKLIRALDHGILRIHNSIEALTEIYKSVDDCKVRMEINKALEQLKEPLIELRRIHIRNKKPKTVRKE